MRDGNVPSRTELSKGFTFTMAQRAAMAPAGRRPAPVAVQQPEPEPQEDVGSVYDEIWGVVSSTTPNFAAPNEQEDDQAFIARLVKAVSVVPEPAWDTLSKEAQDWYEAAVAQFKARQAIDAPQGFYADGTEPVEEPQPEPAPAPTPTTRGHAGAEALRAYNARKAAEKAAGAQTPSLAQAPAGRRAAPVAPTPAATPRGRTPVAAPTPAAAPRGRAPVPATAQRAAPAAAAPQESMASVMREFIIDNYANGVVATHQDLSDYIASQGYSPTKSTVSGTLTFALNMLRQVNDMGHWK